jgi:hypothetical protein
MLIPAARISHPYGVAFEKCEDLPFKVRIANPQEDLASILELRSRAYGRHLPEMAKRLEQAEPDDLRDDALLLVAQCKDTGQLLGSVRLLTNVGRPLCIQQDANLPEKFHHRHLLEARRLTVLNEPKARMAMPALNKAIYEICYYCGIDIVLITARRPVDRLYRAMQFKDALDGVQVRLPDVNNVPHIVLYREIESAEQDVLDAAQWPFYDFMARTRHPDIHIDLQSAYERLCISCATTEEPA